MTLEGERREERTGAKEVERNPQKGSERARKERGGQERRQEARRVGKNPGPGLTALI